VKAECYGSQQLRRIENRNPAPDSSSLIEVQMHVRSMDVVVTVTPKSEHLGIHFR
jgi:hypothetical protein